MKAKSNLPLGTSHRAYLRQVATLQTTFHHRNLLILPSASPSYRSYYFLVRKKTELLFEKINKQVDR